MIDPHALAEQCLRELVTHASFGHVKNVLQPLLLLVYFYACLYFLTINVIKITCSCKSIKKYRVINGCCCYRKRSIEILVRFVKMFEYLTIRKFKHSCRKMNYGSEERKKYRLPRKYDEQTYTSVTNIFRRNIHFKTYWLFWK